MIRDAARARALRVRRMKLSAAQLETLEQDGVLVLPNLFTSEEVERIRQRLPRVYAQDTSANIREKSSGEVRTAMGLHLRDDIFARLVRHPRFVEPAMQILGSEVYIQQVKVNVKAAFSGEPWQWHYDFATHHREDGVPEPLALNLHLFLDDVTEFNGPLYFIRGSHRYEPPPATLDTTSTSYPLWVVDPTRVRALVEEGGLIAAKGATGTGLIFGDTMVHASPSNISPWDRSIFSIILNPISNALTSHARPDHNHHRDLTPVVSLADDCLI